MCIDLNKKNTFVVFLVARSFYISLGSRHFEASHLNMGADETF